MRERRHEPLRAPLPGAYLVVSTVLVGPYPTGRSDLDTRRRLGRLLDAGCNRFVDLTTAGEREPYAHRLPPRARHVRVAIEPGSAPDHETIGRALDAIVGATRDGWLVYVHDAAGVGRAGVIAGCLLAELGLAEGDALTQLTLLRAGVDGPRSPRLPVQRAAVRTWERRCSTPTIRRLAADARATGWLVDGRGVFDPRRERDVRRMLVEALLLDGRTTGGQAAAATRPASS